MAIYSYAGLDAGGAEQQGLIEADSEKEVVRILRKRAIFPIKVQEGERLQLEKDLRSRIGQIARLLHPSRFAPVRSGDLVLFFRQIALMLRAGFTLVSALEAYYEMQTKLGLRRATQRMANDIRRGAGFSASMAKEKRLFTLMAVNLAASGEESGNLDTILERLADSLERSKELKRQMLSAMFYPTLVIAAALAIIFVMVTYVIPKFATFLEARHAVLPASTQMLMNVSDWALRWGGPVGAVLGIAVFLVLAAYTTRRGKRVLDRVILALPVVGKAVLVAAMAQAGWSMAMLLKSGITALKSLRITGSVIGNLAVAECFTRAADGLLDGRPLSATFDQPHIPRMMRYMAAVGEKSGQLDTVMYEVGEYYQKELVAKVKFLTVMVEPALILMAGGLAFFVYYSIFQAVMSVTKGGM